MSEHNITNDNDFATPHELTAVESNLLSLTPREDRIEREYLMFLLGRSSALKDSTEQCQHNSAKAWNDSVTFWSRAFGVMSTVAALLLVMLLARNQTYSVQKQVQTDSPLPVVSQQILPTQPFFDRNHRLTIDRFRLSTLSIRLADRDELFNDDLIGSLSNSSSAASQNKSEKTSIPIYKHATKKTLRTLLKEFEAESAV